MEFDTEDKVLYSLFFLFFFWSLFVKFALIEILTHLKRKYFIIFFFLCPTLHHIVNWIIKYPFISDKISIFFIDIYRLSAKWMETHLSSEKCEDTKSLNSFNSLFEYFFSLAMFIEKFRLASNQVVYLSLCLQEGLKNNELLITPSLPEEGKWKKDETSWGWAVPSSDQLKLATH